MNSRVYEILARFEAIDMAEEELRNEKMGLHEELRKILIGTKHSDVKQGRTVQLMFEKNFIAWGNGKALVIRGKGYAIIRALYNADKMRLKEATLDRLVWGGKVKHKTFTEFIRSLADRLDMEEFPYALLPLKSQQKIVLTDGKTRSGNPAKRFVDAEIIGVRLHPRVLSGNLASNNKDI